MSIALFGLYFWHVVLGMSMFLTALFLILLVLVQRGRGGGLTGALGGMGGQSAFGTKAGDMFTRVTMVTATIWILLCMVSIKVLNSQQRLTTSSGAGGQSTITAPGETETEDAGTIDATESTEGEAGGTIGGIGAPTTTQDATDSGETDTNTDQ